jgi:protein tyrosine phosphatase (PTP) superfamily phosphohydrolase (DUF442 family)
MAPAVTRVPLMNRRLARPAAFLLATCAALATTVSAQKGAEKAVSPASQPTPEAPGSRPEAERKYVKIGDLPGVQVVVRMSQRLLKGAQPDGAEGMASLKKLGVTAILSVEEADAKELEAAKRAGIKVVNIPTEYSGIPQDVGDKIVEAARGIEGTAFTHCHHGKHRGGAATAILRRQFEGLSIDEAVEELKELGCSARYAGLFESVRTYRVNPATAHRKVKPLPGLDDAVEVTPNLLRSSAPLTDDALAALKKLGVEVVVTAAATPAAREKAAKLGFEVIEIKATTDGVTAAEFDAAWNALRAHEKSKTLVHAGGDPATAAALVAAFRLNFGRWSADDAAREIEALVPTDAGRLQAAAVRRVGTASR